LRVPFFILLLGLVALTGCRKRESARYERFKTQLVQEAFEHLAEGRSGRTAKLLQRLQDVSPDEPFYALALAHEQERQAFRQLNQLLVKGRLDKAREFLQQGTGRGASGSPGFARAERIVAALQALEEHLRELPFANSADAEAALKRWEEHLPILNQSPAFQAWLAEQQNDLERLRAKERDEALARLTPACDLAIVSGDPNADLILARIKALDRDYVLLSVVEAGPAAALAGAPRSNSDPDAAALFLASVEMAACRSWFALSADAKATLRKGLADEPVGSLSGLLVRALLAAEAGDVGDAATRVRELAAAAAIGPAFVDCLLQRAVLPEHQFAARCWRSPFPSVSDLLNRIAQLRENR